MKRGFIVSLVFLVFVFSLSLTFVSANAFSDFFHKSTGKATFGVCGDGVLDSGEQCDWGASFNGQKCVPDPSVGSCFYCGNDCQWKSNTADSTTPNTTTTNWSTNSTTTPTTPNTTTTNWSTNSTTTPTTPNTTISVSPGAEKWVVGNTYTILWKSENAPTDAWVGILRLYQGASFLVAVLPENVKHPSSGQVSWTIPENSVTGDGFSLQIILNEGDIGSESNIATAWSEPFSIVSTTPTPTPTPTCTDSDVKSSGSDDFYIEGRITYTNDQGTFEQTDLCADQTYLKEVACDSFGSNPKTLIHRCPNGCLSGVCSEANIAQEVVSAVVSLFVPVPPGLKSNLQTSAGSESGTGGEITFFRSGRSNSRRPDAYACGRDGIYVPDGQGGQARLGNDQFKEFCPKQYDRLFT